MVMTEVKIRKLKVYNIFGKPCIKITGDYLDDYGFSAGVEFEVYLNEKENFILKKHSKGASVILTGVSNEFNSTKFKTRRLKVYDILNKPCIKITGDYLENYGFVPGIEFDIYVNMNQDIILKKRIRDAQIPISSPVSSKLNENKNIKVSQANTNSSIRTSRKIRDPKEFECDSCSFCTFYSRCERMKLSNTPFSEDLLDSLLFPNNFENIEDCFPGIEKYITPKIRAEKIGVKFPKMSFVTHAKFDADEEILTYPLPKLAISATRFSNISAKRQSKIGLLLVDRPEELHDFYNKKNWLKQITARKFDFVFSPAFSFFYNQPSCSTVANRLLVYKSVSEMVEVGIPTIPNFDWLWESDAEEYSKWIIDCGFKYVYIPASLARAKIFFEMFLENLKKSKELLKNEVQIIIVGVNSIERIKRIETEIGSFKYLNSHLPVISSRNMMWSESGEEYLTSSSAISREMLFLENAARYREALFKHGIK